MKTILLWFRSDKNCILCRICEKFMAFCIKFVVNIYSFFILKYKNMWSNFFIYVKKPKVHPEMVFLWSKRKLSFPLWLIFLCVLSNIIRPTTNCEIILKFCMVSAYIKLDSFLFIVHCTWVYMLFIYFFCFIIKIVIYINASEYNSL